MDFPDFNRELHARPSIYFAAPALVCHAAYVDDVEKDISGHNDISNADVAVRAAHEAHAEFHTRTSVVELPNNGHEWPAAPEASLRKIESIGSPIMRVQILVLSDDKSLAENIDKLLVSLGIKQPAASVIGGGDAIIYSNFRIGDDGFGRILLINRGLNEYRLGRMVRRLCEIETYRAMALLGLPLAREIGAILPQLDRRLNMLAHTNIGSTTSDPRVLLDQLSDLASEILGVIARTSHRFGATKAYAEIVNERILELREMHAPGFQRFGVFVNRRFGPAVRTCVATERRLERLAGNVAQLVGLLQTRIQVGLQELNVERLQGMEARTATQIKIQKAVEGLSVIAITYYATSLIKISLEALEYSSVLHTKSWMLVALPLTLFAAVATVFLVRRALRSG